MTPRIRSIAFAALAAIAAATGAARTARASDGVDAVLARMEAADPSLETYRADVDFEIGLRTFPFVRTTLHATSYFKRPDRMEIVFSDLPPIARRFENVYVGLGSPQTWNEKFVISLEPSDTGTAIKLVPRRRGRLRDVIVDLDPASALPDRIRWQYRDARIDMRQSIASIDGHYVVTAQSADMHLPGARAFVKSRVHDYRFNVPVADGVFTHPIVPAAQPPAGSRPSQSE